jgi:NADPH:quinone reductase-like Zn-dependent oxidoreductase
VRGRYGYQPELPASPGAEGVGIVEAVGPGVQGPMVGTRVVFVHTWNIWREQIVCPVDRLVPVPDGLDDPAAATSYTNPLTAWALTRSSLNLKEGDCTRSEAIFIDIPFYRTGFSSSGIRRKSQLTIMRVLRTHPAMKRFSTE